MVLSPAKLLWLPVLKKIIPPKKAASGARAGSFFNKVFLINPLMRRVLVAFCTRFG